MRHKDCGGELVALNPLDNGQWSGSKTYLCKKCTKIVVLPVKKEEELTTPDCPSGHCSL